MIWFPRFLAFASGFISLSLEILWVRYAAFAYRGAPQSFSLVLGLYLIGIAAGAAFGRSRCRRDENLTGTAGRVLLLGGALDLILPWAAAAGLLAGSITGFLGIAAAVVVTAALTSVVFPIAHHLGSSGANRVGASVSKVYFANIAGSTLGPLVTGFVLLEVFSLQQNLMLFALATVALGALCLSRAGALHPLWSGAALAAGLVVLLAPSALLPMLIEAKIEPEHRGTLHNVIENRHGIIHTITDASGVDIVYGGNVYDGGINVDLVADTNGVSRAYILAALHPAPKRILVIGLAGGAWTRVLAGFGGMEQMDVVEINPGYLELVRQYPVVAPLLDDPRVTIHIDDGRRWLRRHPDVRFDLIVMNMSQHWRAYSSLLLSREFNQLVQRHLNPDGIFAYNSTFLWHAFNTTGTVFPYVYAFSNLVIASGRDLSGELVHAAERLAAIRFEGQQVVDPAQPDFGEKIRRMVGNVHRFDRSADPDGRPLEVITDQNMLSEYRYGRTILGHAAPTVAP